MSTQSAQPELARDLKVSHAAAVVVGTVIGSGIFLVPSEMMQAVGSAALVYLAWIVGGLLSWFGALSYAELGAMKPQAGGEYVYIRDAYGPLGGFLYGWTYFLIAKPGSIATIVTGLVRILGTFAPLAFLPQVFIRQPITITYGQLIAVGAIVLITLLNYIGVKRAGEFQLFFTTLKVVIILGIAVAGFTYAGGSWHHFAESYAAATGGFAGFMTALIAALWAYDGWNLVTTVSAEIREPQRSLPIALIFGVAIVALLYMLLNAAVQYAMPPAAIAASPRPASDAMLLVMGSAGAAIVSAGMALSMLVTLNGSTMTGARIPFALARDGYFFHGLAKVHPRFHTPSVALGVQAGAGDRSGAFCGNVPAALLAHSVCGMALLHAGNGRSICFSPSRAGCRASLQNLGIPGSASVIHRGLRGSALLLVHGKLAQFCRRSAGDSGWHSCFCLFPQAH